MRTEYKLGVATIILEGIGQVPPHQGNLVGVKAYICLPAVHGSLAVDLQFSLRLSVDGECLTASWGREFGDGKSRARKRVFAAETWKEARAAAAEWAREEVGKLTETIKIREAALQAAGDWE